MDDRLIRYLKIGVAAGAVVLALGTGLLVWLLLQRARPPAALPAPTTLALPADARIGQAVAAGNQLALVGETPDGRRFLAIVDLATGRRRHLLWIVPEEP